jgi:hypothetical protein
MFASDYVSVPAIETYGVYPFTECMDDFSRASLYVAYKRAEGVEPLLGSVADRGRPRWKRGHNE